MSASAGAKMVRNGWFSLMMVAAMVGTGVGGKLRDLYAAGSECHNSNSPGTCTLLPNCSSAISSVRGQGFHGLKRCGFSGFTEIVCCPNSDLRAVKPTPPPPLDVDQTEPRNPTFVRKSQRACERYSKSLPIVLTYHIVGGEDAEPGEFPHMAALGFYSAEERKYRFVCGGTLISHDYVVTAAHCFVNVQQNELKVVRLGVVNVPEKIDEPDPKVDHNVINFTVYEKYNWKEKLNDIALVKLEKKVTFSTTIRPACLYTTSDDPQRLMITGWGAVGLGAERSSTLQKATLTPFSLSECNTTYQSRTNRYVTKNQLCAADNTSDACQGDSGGPIQTESSNSILTIVGVTSYGIGCGSKYPGVYTRISSYLDWIEAIVWP